MNLISNTDGIAFQLRIRQNVFIQIVIVEMQPQKQVGQGVEIALDAIAKSVMGLRRIRCEHRIHRPEHCGLGDVLPTREQVAQAAHIIRELAVVIPPRILVEHRWRPVPFAGTFQGVMKAVRVEQVDTQHVLPVGDPFHALHGRIHEDAAERFTQQARAAILVRRRAADFHCHVFIGPVAVTDDGVEMVDTGHIHVRIVLEQVAFDPDQAAQSFFVQKVPGEQHIVLFTPFMDLLIERLAIEIGQRVVEVVADAGAVWSDVEEQVRQARAQIVAVSCLEAPEHIPGPGNDWGIAAAQVIMHGRLVGIEAEHLGVHFAVDRAGIGVIAMAQELGCRFRVEGVDVVIGNLLDDVHQSPVTRRRFPGNDIFK